MARRGIELGIPLALALWAVALGVGFLYYAIRLYREEQPNAIAMKTFGYSIFYLSLLFAFLLLDHYARVFIRGWFL